MSVFLLFFLTWVGKLIFLACLLEVIHNFVAVSGRKSLSMCAKVFCFNNCSHVMPIKGSHTQSKTSKYNLKTVPIHFRKQLLLLPSKIVKAAAAQMLFRSYSAFSYSFSDFLEAKAIKAIKGHSSLVLLT